MKEKIFAPVLTNVRFAFFMYVLGFISLLFIHRGGRHVSVFELVVDVYVLCWVLYLLPSKISRCVKGLFYVIAYGLAIVDMFCFSRFGAPINSSLVRVCAETNQREAIEALASYVTWQSISFPLVLIFLLLIVQVITIWWHPKWNIKWNVMRKVNPWGGIVFLLFCVAISAKNKWFMYHNLVQTKTGIELELATEYPHDGGFYLPFYRLLYAWKGISLEEESVEKLERNIGKEKINGCTYRSPNIILIIGEAYNRHHAQLYGYSLPTTPRQSEMASDSSLIAFTDVVAPYHQTSMVFRMAFSMYAYGQPNDWADYPLFPQLFKRCGYQVTFITNQFVPSVADDIFNFNGSVFLNDPDINPSLFSHRNTRTHLYDMGLLEDYDSLRTFQTEHNLVIFHLLGQHTSYRERYPNGEGRFLPKNYQRKDLTNEEKEELAHYDNACLYNDKVVSEIIQRFKNQDAIIIYMPDHGEMCFDNGGKVYGRTISVNTKDEIIQQFDIPFWIWASESYRQLHPDIWQQVKAARNRPFMTDNISQLLIYLAGISCPYYRDSDNLISPRYQTHRKRMLMNEIDYDKAIRE